jgi:glutamyl-tRNA(Gln) amidotransferase subunit E
MYPDTDLPPRRLTDERIAKIVAQMPEPIWDAEARYEKMGVPEQIITKLSLSKYKNVFEKVTAELGIPAKLASVVCVQQIKNIERMKLCLCSLTDEAMFDIFKAYKEGRISRHGILKSMIKVAQSCGCEEVTIPAKISDAELKKTIKSNKAELDKVVMRNPELKDTHFIGLIMKGLEGRVEPLKAFEIYKSL